MHVLKKVKLCTISHLLSCLGAKIFMVAKFASIPLIPQFSLICRINKIILLSPIAKSECIYVESVRW